MKVFTVCPTIPEYTEFPPQRDTLSKTRGNFLSSFNNATFCKERIYHSIAHDRGCPSREMESFVKSLRIYPEELQQGGAGSTPDRERSSELLDRLLYYSQIKNLNKSSCHTRSARAMRKRHRQKSDSKPTDAAIWKSVPRQTQTCIRDVFKMCENGGSRRSHSALDFGSLDCLQSTNQASSWRRFQNLQVGYLCDMTKCIKERIRQICDDEGTAEVCPNMQSRYRDHQRHYHTNNEVRPSTSSNTGVQVSPLIPSGDLSARNYDQLPDTTINISTAHKCTARPKICAICHRLPPCACRILRTPQTNQNLGSNRSLEKQVEEEFQKWMQKIPVEAHEPPGNRIVRKNMLKDLTAKLKTLKETIDERKFTDEAKKETMTCLRELPMWSPEGRREKEVFKEKLSDNLVTSLNKIKLAESEIVSHSKTAEDDTKPPRHKNVSLQSRGSQSDSQANFLENLKSKTHSYEENETKIPRSVSQQSRGNDSDSDITILHKFNVEPNKERSISLKAQKSESDTAIDGFDKTTGKPTATNRLLDDEELSISETQNITNRRSSVKKVQINDISQQYPSSSFTKSPEEQTEEVYNRIMDWLQKDPQLSNNEGQLNEKTARKLAENIKKQRENAWNVNEFQKNARPYIQDWLKKLSQNKGLVIPTNTLTSLADGLFKSVNNATDIAFSHKNDNEMYEEILHTLQLSKAYGDKDNSEYLADIISKTLNDFYANYGDFAYSRDDITRHLSTMLERKVHLPVQDAWNLAESILKRIENLPFESRFNQDENMKEMVGQKIYPKSQVGAVEEDIRNILKDSNLFEKPLKQEQISRKIVDEILRAPNKSVDETQVRNILHSKEHLTNRDADHLAKTIVDHIDKHVMIDMPMMDSEILFHNSDGYGGDDNSRRAGDSIQQDFVDKTIYEILNVVDPFFDDNDYSSRYTVTNNLAQKIKDIQFERNQDYSEKEGMIKDEVMRYLRKISISSEIPHDEIADQIMSHLGRVQMRHSTPERKLNSSNSTSSFEKGLISLQRQNISSRTSANYENSISIPASRLTHGLGPTSPENEKNYYNKITAVIQDWINKLPFDLDNTVKKEVKDGLVKDLAADISLRQKYNKVNPEMRKSDELDFLKFNLFTRLNKLVEPDELIRIMSETKTFLEEIGNINVSDDHKFDGSHSLAKEKESQIEKQFDIKSKQSEIKENAFDMLCDVIESWCDELPFQLGNSPKDKEETANLKRQLANELKLKIAESFFIKPEMLDYDYMYENTMYEDIDKVLNKLLPMTTQINPQLKLNLIAGIKKATKKAKEEIAGQNYKQQIREILNDNLPTTDYPEYDVKVEQIKDNILDNCVLIHGGVVNKETYNKAQKDVLDSKLEDYISEFLTNQNILNSDKDIKTLKNKILDDIEKIPLPSTGYLKSEIEELKMKEKVNDWLNDLPQSRNHNGVQMSKIIPSFTKRLHDLRKNKAKLGKDYNSKFEEEVLNWMRDLSIESDSENTKQQIRNLREILGSLRIGEEEESDITLPGVSSKNKGSISNSKSSVVPPKKIKENIDQTKITRHPKSQVLNKNQNTGTKTSTRSLGPLNYDIEYDSKEKETELKQSRRHVESLGTKYILGNQLKISDEDSVLTKVSIDNGANVGGIKQRLRDTSPKPNQTKTFSPIPKGKASQDTQRKSLSQAEGSENQTLRKDRSLSSDDTKSKVLSKDEGNVKLPKPRSDETLIEEKNSTQDTQHKSLIPAKGSEKQTLRNYQSQNSSTTSNTDYENTQEMESINTEKKKNDYDKTTEVIEDWINRLPIYLSETVKREEMDGFVKDLAEDISLRQKYIKMNPDTKKSHELDFLKFKLFTKLNKLVKPDDLIQIMTETKMLQEEIGNINSSDDTLSKISSKYEGSVAKALETHESTSKISDRTDSTYPSYFDSNKNEVDRNEGKPTEIKTIPEEHSSKFKQGTSQTDVAFQKPKKQVSQESQYLHEAKSSEVQTHENQIKRLNEAKNSEVQTIENENQGNPICPRVLVREYYWDPSMDTTEPPCEICRPLFDRRSCLITPPPCVLPPPCIIPSSCINDTSCRHKLSSRKIKTPKCCTKRDMDGYEIPCRREMTSKMIERREIPDMSSALQVESLGNRNSDQDEEVQEDTEQNTEEDSNNDKENSDKVGGCRCERFNLTCRGNRSSLSLASEIRGGCRRCMKCPYPSRMYFRH